MTQNTPTHLYQEIAESLRRQLAAGELQPGDRLPPVRAMARQWGCTPGTVSRAYAVLADEGLVSGHRGGGTRVAQVPAADDRPFLRWALLINRAEQFLLEAVGGGHTPTQVQAALSLAISRWQA
ncbi:MAG: winged helix-turn-helix transcriptional regulator, partial [Anaerolineales bacterium]|nr:winged helix-turn-helix transcriptional regulator [Anaerolineales bacterium]